MFCIFYRGCPSPSAAPHVTKNQNFRGTVSASSTHKANSTPSRNGTFSKPTSFSRPPSCGQVRAASSGSHHLSASSRAHHMPASSRQTFPTREDQNDFPLTFAPGPSSTTPSSSSTSSSSGSSRRPFASRATYGGGVPVRRSYQQALDVSDGRASKRRKVENPPVSLPLFFFLRMCLISYRSDPHRLLILRPVAIFSARAPYLYGGDVPSACEVLISASSLWTFLTDVI